MVEKLSRQAMVLWAKKRSEDGQHTWLPLVTHLTDVQNVINYLFDHWLSDGQARTLMGDLSDEEIHKLVKLVGFLHDCGKATPAFQAKESFDRDVSLDDQLNEQLLRGGFIGLDRLHLASPNRSPHARAGEAILEGMGVPTSVGTIIGGHHGKPESSQPRNQIRDYTANFYQYDNNPQKQIPWKKVQKELFDYGLETSGYQSVEEIPNVKRPQAVILEGLLIMADWLASTEYLDSERNTPLFPLLMVGQFLDSRKMEIRREAMIKWDQDKRWIPKKIDTKEDPYAIRWLFKGRPVQILMSQAIGETTDPGLVIIEAPMGIGKTEIALVATEQLAYKTGRDGVFFGLPTQATTNAMFRRVLKWLKLLSQSGQGRFPIKLLHSKAQFNELYQSLPNAINIYAAESENDEKAKMEERSGSVVLNDWFSGKKSILTKFTVGTIDNLLQMGLKQKHLFLRHLGFTGKVVVIDEVHAYDAYMDSYLCKAINWLGVYHVPIVILSATLPKAKRNMLLKAYLQGKYGKKYRDQLEAPSGWEDTQAYPLLSILDGNQIKQVTEFSGKSDQSPTHLQVSRLNVSDDDLIAQVLTKISDGGIAGIIVNTVKRAQMLARLVPADTQLMVLHSAFLATDRTSQETELQAAIGNHVERPQKMIVIGTQVLEQSLDIDFDVLYTDIAPMDLILQRAGRLHRHQIERPKALKAPQIFILGIQGNHEYGSGNEFVYGKYLLMKTDHFLKTEIILPDDISPLVQQVYDPSTDSEVADIDDAKAKSEGNLTKEKKKAKVFQISDADYRINKPIYAWLDRDAGNVDKDEQRASAAVRDIKETIEVILLQHTDEEDCLLDGRQVTAVQSQEIAQQVIRLPAAITPNSDTVDQIINNLEKLTHDYFGGWQSDMWLKGMLVLPLNKQFSTTLAGWRLSYSSKLGLEYMKEDERHQ